MSEPSGERSLVAVYADESCLGNGQSDAAPGGAGALIEWCHPRTGGLHRWDLWISEPATTNNRMALRSVIDTFAGLSARGRTFQVVFTTDSRYVVDGMTSWVHSWARQGWRRKGGPIENLALWQDALRALDGHACEWRWVRGHHGHPQNEYANHLATRAAARQDSSGGLVPSRFDEWLAEHAGKGVVAQPVAPFPSQDSFRGVQRAWTI